MKERENAANREIKALRDQDEAARKELMRLRAEIDSMRTPSNDTHENASSRKELMRLRAENDALRAQIVRADRIAPDAHELSVELASVRASIYEAKAKNDSLIIGIVPFFFYRLIFVYLNVIRKQEAG